MKRPSMSIGDVLSFIVYEPLSIYGRALCVILTLGVTIGQSDGREKF